MPKKTVDQIVDSGNHYVLQVKRNQKTLFNEIEETIVNETPLDHYEEWEKDHGRTSHWSVRVFNASNSSKAKEWNGLKRFIHVHKYTLEKGKESHNDRLYISDHYNTDAQFYHTGIRGHWKIENSLHWVKDVIHKEDKNRIKTKNGPINSSVFSSIAINLHRLNGNYSITDGNVKACKNITKLFRQIRT